MLQLSLQHCDSVTNTAITLYIGRHLSVYAQMLNLGFGMLCFDILAHCVPWHHCSTVFMGFTIRFKHLSSCPQFICCVSQCQSVPEAGIMANQQAFVVGVLSVL